MIANALLLGSAGAAVGVGVICAFALYMLPTIIGAARKVVNVGSVFAINLLLGWTLIGWAIALAMALRTNPPRAYPQTWTPPPPPKPGYGIPQGSPGLSPSMPSKSLMQAEGWVYRPSPSGIDGLEIEGVEYGDLLIDSDGVGIGARKPKNIKLRWSEVSDVTCEEDPVAEFTCQDGRSVIYRFWDISAETLRSVMLEAWPNGTQDTPANEMLRGQGSIYRPSPSGNDELELDDADYGNVFIDRDGIGIGKTKPERIKLSWSEVTDVTCEEEPVVEFTCQDGRLVGYRVRDVSAETLRSAILDGWPEGRASLAPPRPVAKPSVDHTSDGVQPGDRQEAHPTGDTGAQTPDQINTGLVKCVVDLEGENVRLKKIVADQALEIDRLRELNQGDI
jgi:hypothetical protein